MKKETHKKTLKEQFNESVNSLRLSFPEELGNFLLISTEKTIYISPEIADELSKNTSTVKRLINESKNYIEDHNLFGVAKLSYPFNNKELKLIALKLSLTPPAYHMKKYTKEMYLTYILNHELGHIVIKEGHPHFSYQKHLGECAADAFAALRHVQIFGKDTDFFNSHNKAHVVVFNLSPIHYTNATTEAVAKEIQKQDVSKLSLKETAALASKIAVKQQLDINILKKIETAYHSVGMSYKKKTNYYFPSERKTFEELPRKEKINLILQCTDVMLKHQNDHDIFHAGNLFLNRVDVKALMFEEAKKDPFIKAQLKKITLKAGNTPSSKPIKIHR